MMNVRGVRVVLALALVAVLTGPALAGKIPPTRTETPRFHGTRVDLTVPYTTNADSLFGVYNGVAPRIYTAPQVDNPFNPGSRPMFNIPFYGARVGDSGYSNGVIEKPYLLAPSPRRP